MATLPAPVVVRGAAPAVRPAGYFDPSRPRRPRSRFPTPEEIAAFVRGLDGPLLHSLEALAGTGETVLELVTRRVAALPKCACGALAEGELGHRSMCPEFREWRFGMDNPWLKRRPVVVDVESEPGDDDGFPF